MSAASLEDKLARLSELSKDPASPDLGKELSKALSSKSNLLVAKAARVAAELKWVQVTPELVDAFERLLLKPLVSDKGCTAKTEIAKALHEMEYPFPDVFLKGIRHVQLEPSWGGTVDTAAELRGISALGLVQAGYRDVLYELVNLLMDKEPGPRIVAAKAIGLCGREEGALLLRLKVLHGDTEPEVLAESFTALLGLSAEKSLPFVAGYLDVDNPAICEASALSLGQSRQPTTFPLLKAKWQRVVEPALKRTLLVAIAMLRQEDALEFLFSLISAEEIKTASVAVSVLAMYRHDDNIRERVQSMCAASKDKRLVEAFESEFDAM